ncbi:hypothetical protein ABH927_002676 [Planotetraspora sp. GP83]
MSFVNGLDGERKGRRMRVVLGTVVMGAAVALAAGGCSAEPQPAASAVKGVVTAPAVPKETGDTLAQGKVVDKGRPRAAVQVLAVAWPKSEVLDKIAEGADVPTAVVARATTDANGLFQLRLKPSDLDPVYVEDGGDVQIELFLQNQDGPSWQFTATRGDKGWSTTDAEPGKERPLKAELELDPASGELKVRRLDTTAAQS